MLTGTITGIDAFDDIVAALDRIQSADPGPLAERIAGIVRDDIVSRIAGGRTATGAAFAPHAPSTLKHDHGSGRMGGSLGSTVTVNVEVLADRVVVAAGWGGQQAVKAAAFSEGSPRHNQPARPLGGISDRAAEQVRAAVADYAREVLGI